MFAERDYDYNGHHYRIVPVEGSLDGAMSVIQDNRRVVTMHFNTLERLVTKAEIEELFNEKLNRKK